MSMACDRFGRETKHLEDLVGKLKGTCQMGLDEVVLLEISYTNRM